MEELQVSILYLSRTNQATFCNNAMCCYDHIIIALENLVARRFGMPEEIAKLHSSTLAQMKCCVSTAMGISKDNYSLSKESPVYGTGQGSFYVCLLTRFQQNFEVTFGLPITLILVMKKSMALIL
jgi:hypothetical protein